MTPHSSSADQVIRSTEIRLTRALPKNTSVDTHPMQNHAQFLPADRATQIALQIYL